MELAVHALSFTSFSKNWESKPQGRTIPDSATCSSIDVRLQEQGRKTSTVCYSLPETAAPVAIAATVVGAAITLLVRRNKPTEPDKIPLKTCEDCGGSGICAECNGEGFVLKKLSEEGAERARMSAKNMATRYTAGYILSLPLNIYLWGTHTHARLLTHRNSTIFPRIDTTRYTFSGFQKSGATVRSAPLPDLVALVVGVES
ncbi:hypothetical protein OIU79_013527 [Salix purpurea]|uniref:DUF7895 domain-containing protein n=1 Tax=Salix purpurea TaxID=77065 RepID=A0A9Q0SVR3_SALPP|nr:Transmembrane protein [Salix suchowensis]KAJ6691517.1 hypothetical protein OIU79_013527 [Salix purpurea]